MYIGIDRKLLDLLDIFSTAVSSNLCFGAHGLAGTVSGYSLLVAGHEYGEYRILSIT